MADRAQPACSTAGAVATTVCFQKLPPVTVSRPGTASRGLARPRAVSSPPATTGVPGASPVWLEASPQTWPTTVPASTTSGNKAVSRPHRASSSGDQARRPRSNSPEVEPIDASVASVPVSRNTIQSAIMLSRVASAHTPGS